MPVHRSRHPDIGALIGQLAHADPVVRESAEARLVVVGDRAVPAVRTLLHDSSASSSARVRALRTLAAIDRHRAIEAAAVAAVGVDEALALDAIDLLAEAVSGATDPVGGDRALEHLTRLTLDPSVAEHRRLVMMEPLSRLPAPLRTPIFDALASDASRAIAARATNQDTATKGALARWSDADRLPPEPDALAEAIAIEGHQAPLTALRRLVDLVRAREKIATDVERDGWRGARGLLHETLAQRGSLIALYDLRETLEQVDRSVSAHFLTAAMAVADASCLDAIAARWVHAGQDVWLRDQLERIFHAIINRERLGRSSPVLVRLLKRHPAGGPLVATAPRTRPTAR
ncbi:MAG: hypothetical protein IT183_00445 [Acidobacteria bacterium]|nr:hypothetical protein [Acidobacteriota bacterium]